MTLSEDEIDEMKERLLELEEENEELRASNQQKDSMLNSLAEEITQFKENKELEIERLFDENDELRHLLSLQNPNTMSSPKLDINPLNDDFLTIQFEEFQRLMDYFDDNKKLVNINTSEILELTSEESPRKKGSLFIEQLFDIMMSIYDDKKETDQQLESIQDELRIAVFDKEEAEKEALSLQSLKTQLQSKEAEIVMLKQRLNQDDIDSIKVKDNSNRNNKDFKNETSEHKKKEENLQKEIDKLKEEIAKLKKTNHKLEVTNDKMATFDSKEEERQSLAQEMMNLALMARGTVKLYSLIGREPEFDLSALKSKISKMSASERDAEEIKQLWKVVNDLTDKKTNLEEDILSLQEAADKLRKDLADNKEINQQLSEEHNKTSEKLNSVKQNLEKSKEDANELEISMIRRLDEKEKENKLQNEKLEELQQELRNAKKQMQKGEKELLEELSSTKLQLKEKEKELSKSIEEYCDAQNDITALKKNIDDLIKENTSEIDRLSDEVRKAKLAEDDLKCVLKDKRKLEEEIRALREQVEIMENEDTRKQLDKLYWVNKELIEQIKERDYQTERLKADFRELQEEDKLKNLHLETLDAKSREKDHQRDILSIGKKELLEANQRFEQTIDALENNLQTLQNEKKSLVEDLNTTRERLKEKDLELKAIIPDLERYKDKERAYFALKVDIDHMSKELEDVTYKWEHEKMLRESLEAEQNRLEDEVSSTNKELQSELISINSSSFKLKTSLAKKDKNLNTLKHAYEVLRSERDVLKSRIKELEFYFDEYMKLTDNGAKKKSHDVGKVHLTRASNLSKEEMGDQLRKLRKQRRNSNESGRSTPVNTYVRVNGYEPDKSNLSSAFDSTESVSIVADELSTVINDSTASRRRRNSGENFRSSNSYYF